MQQFFEVLVFGNLDLLPFSGKLVFHLLLPCGMLYQFCFFFVFKFQARTGQTDGQDA